MRFIFHTSDNKTKDVRVFKTGNTYHAVESDMDNVAVPCYSVYFIVAFMTFITGALTLLLLGSECLISETIINMAVYTVVFILFGLLNMLNYNLFSHVLLDIFVLAPLITWFLTKYILTLLGA